MRRTRVALALLVSAIVTATTLAPRSARSQTAEDKTAAEALFDEGKKLLGEKRFAEACARFEGSQRLDPGVGTLLFLADCYETVGRTASAWSTFREAASAAKSAGQGDREQLARERAGKLADKLFQLTLTVTGAPGGLKLMRGDKEVKSEVWGAAVPVDPGTYKITATAPGKKPWSTTVEVPPGAGARTVEVPALEDAPPEPVVTAKPSATAVVTAAPVTPPPPGWSSARIGGLVIGLAGLAGVGVGAAFGGVAASQYSSVKKRCPNLECGDLEAVNLSNKAGSSADVSTALFAAGGAVLAAGVVIFLVSPAKAAGSAPQTSWISPMIGDGAAGAMAGRSF